MIELNLTGVTSQVIAGLPSTLYLDIAGTTSSPITLTTVPLSPAVILIDPFTLDWTATLSDTRFGGTSSSVPEPSTYALLLIGLVSLCWNAHRRKDRDEGARAG